MKLAIGCDHAGLNLKNHLRQWLLEKGHQVEDYGTYTSESMDYPDIAATVAQAVAEGTHERGILVCGSGIGVCMTANKVQGIRAAQCYNPIHARFSRQHNDCNLMTLGERLTTPMVAKEIVETWLTTEFEGGRHTRRVEKIEQSPAQKTSLT